MLISYWKALKLVVFLQAKVACRVTAGCSDSIRCVGANRVLKSIYGSCRLQAAALAKANGFL